MIIPVLVSSSKRKINFLFHVFFCRQDFNLKTKEIASSSIDISYCVVEIKQVRSSRPLDYKNQQNGNGKVFRFWW